MIRPEKDTPENTKHNYYVSKVRIRSEHCVGFLKGRWQSLKGLRVHVDGQKGIQYAGLWITTCIHLHSFAMQHEDNGNIQNDQFFRSGVKYVKHQRELEKEWRERQRQRAADMEREQDESSEILLLEAKIKREEMKEELFRWLDEVELSR
jgi:hypothetical protein